MKSIKTVFKIGNGPSSSHTVGPYSASMLMKKRYPEANYFKVTLFGSLAFTGQGHSTGKAIKEALVNADVLYDVKTWELPHPNTMLFEIYKDKELIAKHRIFSIGGGSIRIEGEESDEEKEIYPHKNFTEMMEECKRDNISIIDFIRKYEGDSIFQYLEGIWYAMQMAVERGIEAEGILPGGLNITKKAKMLYNKRTYNESADVLQNRLIASFAYAVSEENASENVVVTAPTCGAAGVIPACLYFLHHVKGIYEHEIIEALAVAGLFGNVIRTNASISGAEAGCQAEIGSACSMASAAISYINKLDINQIEYAAEIAMEHSLGLTCDPIHGLVQIPCIERNAVAAMRAFTSSNLARFLAETRKISFDEVIETMYQTGKDLNEKYRETSHGGLATMYDKKKQN